MQPPLLKNFIRIAADIISSIISSITGGKGTASSQADEYDRTYEDALLDLQIRSFLRAEYAKQPPPSTFHKLMQVITRSTLAQKPATQQFTRTAILSPSFFRSAPAALYRVAARFNVGRSISGSLATLLLVAVMWPNMMHALNGRTPANPHFETLPATTTIQQPPGFAPAQHPTLSTTSSAQPIEANTPAPIQNISPGLIYEQPRMRLTQRLGEDLDANTGVQSDPSVTSPDVPAKKQIEWQPEPEQIQTCIDNAICVS